MRMVDLRPTATASDPGLEIRSSAGAELLRLIGVLADPEPEGYDVGVDRIERLQQRLPEGLIDACRALDTDDDKSFHIMSLLGAALPEPAGVDDLLGLLAEDPGLGWRLLLANQAATDDERGDIALGEAILAGDVEAITTVRAWGEEHCQPRILQLLGVDPEQHGTELMRIITRFRPVWAELEREAMGAIDRDVAHRRAQVDADEPIAAIVLEATNGYELTGDQTVKRIVLMPSFWCRPWLVVAHQAGTEIISSVVADAFVVLPSEAPPPTLLKLFKALADEGRLKLVRRMSGGPISLPEATEELEVAKATAHHHLSILRQAGLVSMRGEGRDARYALREDPPDAAHAALAAYVRPQR